jgi:hypothetical protein
MIRYLPNNLDINKILLNNPPYTKIKNFSKDFLIYLISLIYYQNWKINDTWIKKGAVPLNSTILQQIKRNYNQYIDYLINNKILALTNNYSTSSHISKCYEFTELYQNQEIKSVELTDKKLIAKLQNNPKSLRKNESKNNNSIDCPDNYTQRIINPDTKIFQDNVLRKLSFDEAVYDEINLEKDINKKNRRKISVLNIQNKNIISSRDNTSYRYHSNLTRLKRELKNYLRYNGQGLVSVDISNSQPYFSLMLFNPQFWEKNNHIISEYFNTKPDNLRPNRHLVSIKDIQQYIKKIPSKEFESYKNYVLDGNIYDRFQYLLKEEHNVELDRSDVKTLFFYFLFSSNYSFRSGWDYLWREEYKNDEDGYRSFLNKCLLKKLFKKEFPHIYKFFSLIKKHNHPRLPKILQAIESHCVLDTIYPKIVNEYNIYEVLTIHDSILTIREHGEQLNDIFGKEITNYTGYKPKLKYENLYNEIEK